MQTNERPFQYHTVDGVLHTCRCGDCRKLAQQELDEAFQRVVRASDPIDRLVSALQSWCVTLVVNIIAAFRPSPKPESDLLPPPQNNVQSFLTLNVKKGQVQDIAYSPDFKAMAEALRVMANAGKVSASQMITQYQETEPYQPQPDYEEMLYSAPDWPVK